MPYTLGIDFGYATNTPSLGYSRFETRTCHGAFQVLLAEPSQVSTLANFRADILLGHLARDISLIALDAPITPGRIEIRPQSGRQVEKRFSRGDFSNGNRGPQPSSISVPRQGWPLYSGAMVLLEELLGVGFSMPTIQANGEEEAVVCSGKVCIEVCPKLTQTLLTPKQRVVNRPAKKANPAFYRQIDNWLFAHIFVPAAPQRPYPSGGSRPNWGTDRLGMCKLLGDQVQIDQSVWDEATRISIVRPLTVRHELIGAFVAGFQGAITLAGASVAVGASGDHEGYYVLPARWHADWCQVWNGTNQPDDCVKRFPISLPRTTDTKKNEGNG